MAYQIAIAQEPGYLHFRVTGENSPGAVRGYLAEVYAACVERNVGTVLIEENLAGPGPSFLDIYQIVEEGSARTSVGLPVWMSMRRTVPETTASPKPWPSIGA